MTIHRYPTYELVTSSQNGFVDVMDWLGFLCAKDYLIDVLQRVHALSAVEARQRALQIIPHVRIARGFIQQSLDGPADLAFLPAYYAILNLSKVYVLFGPRHADLQNHRTHGANYRVVGKDSHTILTELVTLWPTGAFSLFYETLTGRRMPAKKFDLQIKTILSRIAGIGHEYVLATGSAGQLCTMTAGFIQRPSGFHSVAAITQHGSGSGPVVPQPKISVNSVRCLRGFAPLPASFNHFVGSSAVANVQNPEVALRTQLRTHLIYRLENWTVTPLGSAKIEFPEEVPIWLLFFYMSSITRYKPEFFSRLKDSRYWPPVSGARLHSFLDFLLAFWSFVHQKTYFVHAP
jgi:hypothetical protein